MKTKTLIFLGWIGIHAMSFGQIALQKNQHLAKKGETYIYKQIATSNFNSGGSGANALWDFSQLDTTGQNLIYSFSFDSNNACTGMDDVDLSLEISDGSTLIKNHYYQVKMDTLFLAQYKKDGYCALHENLYQLTFPFLFGSKIEQSTAGSSGAYSTSLKRTIKGESYGTLKLPGASWEALRVLTREEEYETAGGISGSWSKRSVYYTYDWYISSSSLPVLTYEIDSMDIALQPTITYQLKVLSNYPELISQHSSQKMNLSFGVYPNPFKSFVHLENVTPNLIVEIVGFDGKVLLSNNCPADGNLSTDNLTDGIYILLLKSAEGEIVFKQLISK